MIGNKTINYAVYDRTDGGRRFLQDTKSVKRPDIEFQTDTIKGPGMLGEIEMPTLAQINSLSHEINLRRETVDTAGLMEPKIHEMEIDWTTDALDAEGKKLVAVSNKEIIRYLPKKFGAGNLEGGTSEDGTLSVEDLYYKRIQDGNVLYEIDKLNNVCIINGVDYAADIRNNT